MAPLYSWHCDVCDTGVDVLRDFANSGEPPIPEDHGYPKAHADGGPHMFRRVIHAPRTIRGPAWNGKKGEW